MAAPVDPPATAAGRTPADIRAELAERLIPQGRVYVSGSVERIEFNLTVLIELFGITNEQAIALIDRAIENHR